jgi:hypothetical protein
MRSQAFPESRHFDWFYAIILAGMNSELENDDRLRSADECFAAAHRVFAAFTSIFMNQQVRRLQNVVDSDRANGKLLQMNRPGVLLKRFQSAPSRHFDRKLNSASADWFDTARGDGQTTR